MSYETDRAELFAARATIARLSDSVLAEAVKRGETYTLDYTWYGSKSTQRFLTLEDALARANDDLHVRSLRSPEGVELDHHTGAPEAA
jgi:hypothetical protein